MLAACAAILYLLYRLDARCPIRAFLHIHCPACGMKRAALAVLQLDIVAAWHINPLIFLLPVGAWLFLSGGKPFRSARVNRLLLLSLPLLVGIWYIYRLCYGR